MRIVSWNTIDNLEKRDILRRPAINSDREVRAAAARIIDDVKQRGDDAIRGFAREFDKVELGDFLVTEQEHKDAEDSLDSVQLGAIDIAIENVRRFHLPQIPQDITVETQPGVHCQLISHPISAVGLYVPAGTAPLPSTAIMLAVPAAIAGCSTRILCTPCRANGLADPAVVVAAKRAGVTQIFKVGGAQAIAAMAFGTQSIPKTDKIFGPGNAWVTAAKTQVAGRLHGTAIDMPAGPSELLVIADDSANASFVAADLLSQAEHGRDSQVLLICTSAKFAATAVATIEQQISSLPRQEIARAALEHSKIIVVDDLSTGIQISNEYAPEHLIVHCATPRAFLGDIRNAGSIFLGPWSPESVGDYCSGTNHVLPTYGFAKSYSGLGVAQFMRQMTVQQLTKEGLERLAPTAIELAQMEGLAAHANAVRRRFQEDIPGI